MSASWKGALLRLAVGYFRRGWRPLPNVLSFETFLLARICSSRTFRAFRYRSQWDTCIRTNLRDADRALRLP